MERDKRRKREKVQPEATQRSMTDRQNPALAIMTSQSVRMATSIQSYQTLFFIIDNTNYAHLLIFFCKPISE
ncbi:hypothetical protein C1T21_26505 [Paenibacillus sp. F4]|nr:hypothetical protein C1T21_26505 [Paenibacillus sp. F4]